MKVMRIKEMISSLKKLLIFKQVLLVSKLKKCVENSLENMHTDVRV